MKALAIGLLCALTLGCSAASAVATDTVPITPSPTGGTFATPPPASLPPVGLSRDEAIAAVERLAPNLGPPTGAIAEQVSALGLPFIPGTVSANRFVWAIIFPPGGVVCPPAPGATCAPDPDVAVWVLDYVSGQFLFTAGLPPGAQP